MREVFCISYYNSKKESISILRNLVFELKSRSKKIIICGHSSIPQDLIDICDGYIYDKENKKISVDQSGVLFYGLQLKILYCIHPL